MKLEDMIMAVENRKGTETNFLTDMCGFMEMAVKACDDSAIDLADAVEALYETKAGKGDWSDLYFAGNKSIHAAFCTGEAQLRGFLAGNFNNGGWSFDEERSSGKCLDVLRMYNMKPDGQPQFPYLHYERLEHSFHTGEVLHNMNGNDYRVLAVLSPKDLLLVGMMDSQFIVGKGTQLYERYPKGERPDDDSMVVGIEWDHGVYLGNDITKLDFDILKQEYGEPDRVETVYDLREKIRRDFWMQKNVEMKEGLPDRVRNAAKGCLENTFGTNEPEIFAKMLDKGMYDGMYETREEQKKISGQSR